MTETILCNKCGKPVSYNFTVNTNATAVPVYDNRNWIVNTTATATNPSAVFTFSSDMCQCGGS